MKNQNNSRGICENLNKPHLKYSETIVHLAAANWKPHRYRKMIIKIINFYKKYFENHWNFDLDRNHKLPKSLKIEYLKRMLKKIYFFVLCRGLEGREKPRTQTPKSLFKAIVEKMFFLVLCWVRREGGIETPNPK